MRQLLLGRTNLAFYLIQRGAPDDLGEARRLLELALEAANRLRLPEARTIQGLLEKTCTSQHDAGTAARPSG